MRVLRLCCKDTQDTQCCNPSVSQTWTVQDNPCIKSNGCMHQVTSAAYLKLSNDSIAARGQVQATVSAVFFGHAFTPAQLTETLDAGMVAEVFTHTHLFSPCTISDQSYCRLAFSYFASMPT